MEIKAIHDEAGYRAALAELDRMWDAPKGSPGSDRMEVLTILVADYERQHHAISPAGWVSGKSARTSRFATATVSSRTWGSKNSLTLRPWLNTYRPAAKMAKRTIPDDDYRAFPDVSEHSAGGSFQVA